MNKSRRKRIASVIDTLENITGYNLVEPAKSEIEDILWEEQDAYDNMPENLQYSMRGEESSDAIDSLQEAVDVLEEALDILNEIDGIDDDEDYEETEKESLKEIKEDEVDDYINQAIDNLEQII